MLPEYCRLFGAPKQTPPRRQFPGKPPAPQPDGQGRLVKCHGQADVRAGAGAWYARLFLFLAKRRRHFVDTQRNPPESYDFGGFLPNPGQTPLTCIPPACRTAPRTGINSYAPYSILVVWKLPG